MKHKIILPLLCFLFILSNNLRGHPHFFIDIKAKIEFNAKGLKSIKAEWISEDIFGESIAKSSPEKYILWCKAWLKRTVPEKNYFCYVYVNGKMLKKLRIKLDEIVLKQNSETVHFLLSIDNFIPFKDSPQVIDFVFSDETCFVALAWQKDEVIFSGNTAIISELETSNEDQVLRFSFAPKHAVENRSEKIASHLPDYVKMPIIRKRSWQPSWLINFQVKWNRKIHKNLKQLKAKFNWIALLILAGGSFAYGVFHAAGPGHGKAVLMTYFLSKERSFHEVPGMPMLITFIHTGSAIILVLIFYCAMRFIKPDMRPVVQNHLSFVMALTILFTGIAMFFKALLSCRGKTIDPKKQKSNDRKLVILAGLFPCPQSIAIMLGCIMANAWHLGFMVVTCVSLGTFAVLLVTALITYSSSKALPYFIIGNNSKRKNVSENILKWGKIFLLIAAGCLLSILYMP